MHICKSIPLAAALLFLGVAWSFQSPLAQGQDLIVDRLEAEPGEVTVRTGESTPFTVTAYDADGNVVDTDLTFRAPRTAMSMSAGELRGGEPGTYDLVASVAPGSGVTWEGDSAPSVTVPVEVTPPAVSSVEIHAGEGTLYEGTVLDHRAIAYHADGSEREEPSVVWSSSDESVATVDRFGNVTAHAVGTVEVNAAVDGTVGTQIYAVEPFTGERLVIEAGADEARTGDVLNFEARVLDASGNEVSDVPVTWSTTAVPSDSVGAHAGALGQVWQDGAFVAQLAGQHTVLAQAGPLAARQGIHIAPRRVVQAVEKVGQGRVSTEHTSDFWVFEGQDGRDYALTGTWGADGYTFVWDVTDPPNMVRTDSIQVDARTVNDVKVSPDSRYAVITREGASDRRNGLVILDLQDPAHPTIASTFDDGLTGGVHNSFPTNDYLFALSAGEKFVILDVTDIENPQYVSEYNHPNARIHDVHVEDGIAYTSQWGAGVVIVDVGNGRWGGTIEEPRLVTTITTPGGATHATFPYYSESADRFYLFAGDEILNRNNRALGAGTGRTLHTQAYDPETGLGGRPSLTAGYIHVIDWTDPDDPQLVARYEQPEYGTHNIWVKDDVLYQAYYEGGARMVDVSGELRGNLAQQDREIAVFKSFDPEGYIANAPMVWTAYPFKDRIFFSDWNSGLWAIEMVDLN